ncbi:MAG: amidohydrolase family protein, partial [Opitutae bacterium]|nr:amidohydrolase family protein [Opitutae bacterium]
YVVAALLRHGTTGVLATMGYPEMAAGTIQPQLQAFARALEGLADRAVVLGVHLEGPYTNPKYGARVKASPIRPFDPAEYGELIAHPLVRWWTCAPEIPGARPFIEAAARRGIVVAAGHTEATAEQTITAIGWGLRAITHWTNATGNVAKPRFGGTRLPGIDEVALVRDDLSVEIIPDAGGCHVHPLMAQLLYRAQGPDRVLIITDTSYRRSADPLPANAEFQDVNINAAGELAGSRLTMNGAVRNFRRATGCPLPELFRMAALNTARLLGIDRTVGSIEVGKRANLVMLDDAFNVRATFLDGRCVFDAGRKTA